jgi:glycosyltransferase involved in cell wall biosynthesis
VFSKTTFKGGEVKILQLVPAMEQGGVERGVVEVNRAIVAAGWSNVVVSNGGRLVAEILKDGSSHITVDVKSKNPLTFFSRARKLRRVLKAEKPDVVCVHSRVPAWLFIWAGRSLNIKWISFAHGANSVSLYSKVMTYGNIVVTPSRYIADYLKDNYGLSEEKIRVIPRAIEKRKFDINNLDHEFIREKRREWAVDGSFVVMGLGRITQLKGYDILIKAVAKLPDRFKLVIVGEAEKLRQDVERSLRELAKNLGVEKRVVFAGNQSKVAECLTIADVVVSSNVRKPEAFGRSMAEALAMGKPVVAKAFGGALDVVRSGIDGLLVAADGSKPYEDDFSQAIEEVSKMKFSSLREDALERFDFEKMLERSISVYKELAGNGE